MASRVSKPAWFMLEGINAFATAYYLYYLFFFLRDHHSFGNAQNLATSALHGLIYMLSCWFAGRYSQRAGYAKSLAFGLAIMAVSLLITMVHPSIPLILGGLTAWTIGVSLTWPSLEALATDGEPPDRLPRMVGIYNLVWSGGSAGAYFVGGALKDWLGDASIFWLPAATHLLQLCAVWFLGRSRHGTAVAPRESPTPTAHAGALQAGSLTLAPRSFMIMAWVANPFAYVAINAALPVIPDLARRLQLATREAGFFCSIWFFARTATFALLWQWTGWHYRFRWMVTAFVTMTLSFAVMLLGGHLWLIAMAQVGFGFGVGVIYYASLFYSMDAGETKGEHGGIHEAAIGSGVFAGSAIGATGQFLLGSPSSSTWVVSGLLATGLAALLVIRGRLAKRS
jgi:MFS family permease